MYTNKKLRRYPPPQLFPQSPSPKEVYLSSLHIVVVRVLRKIEPIRDRDRGRFKELIHKIVEVGKFKICQAGWQAGDPGKS